MARVMERATAEVDLPSMVTGWSFDHLIQLNAGCCWQIHLTRIFRDNFRLLAVNFADLFAVSEFASSINAGLNVGFDTGSAERSGRLHK